MSLVVTTSLFSAMPSPPGLPFPKMELRRTLLPVAAAPMIMTLWLRLLEMVLATVPPTKFARRLRRCPGLWCPQGRCR